MFNHTIKKIPVAAQNFAALLEKNKMRKLFKSKIYGTHFYLK
jgi:hypothetical protein